jgi:hypothetical protein
MCTINHLELHLTRPSSKCRPSIPPGPSAFPRLSYHVTATTMNPPCVAILSDSCLRRHCISTSEFLLSRILLYHSYPSSNNNNNPFGCALQSQAFFYQPLFADYFLVLGFLLGRVSSLTWSLISSQGIHLCVLKQVLRMLQEAYPPKLDDFSIQTHLHHHGSIRC